MSRPIPVDDSDLVQIISGNAIPTDARPCTTTIRIYLHSDCIDTYYERSRLWRDVFPDVCDYARSLGLHLSIVDPYHMMDCLPEQRNQILPFALEVEGVYQLNMKEITICQEFSGGISFMTLLGQKYGYRALREAIEEEEFGVICNNIEDRESTQLLKVHYRLDKKLMPSQYVLRKPSEMNEAWAKVQSTLAKNIRKGARVAYGKDPTKVQGFTVSVTEEEIAQGVLTLQGVDQPHSAWFKRTFTDLTDQRPSTDSALGYYSDVTEGKRGLEFDSETVKLLNYLKEARMPTGLNPANIFDFPIKWHKGKGLAPDCNEDHESYLKQLCKTMTQYFKGMLAIVSEKIKSERIHPIYQECILHGQHCRQLLRNFKERKDVSEQILSYLNAITITNASFPLVIYGESGSGKSSVIASVVRDIQQSVRGDKCCVVRFVGLTPSSRDIRRLLISICQQISLAYGCNNLVPASHESVQKTFNQLICSVPTRDKPLFIFLDGIDSLDTDNEALGLPWLPATLPPNVGLVVTVSSEVEYRCYHLLRSIIRKKSSFVQVPTLSLDKSEVLLQYFLELEHLRITPFHTFLLSDALKTGQSLTPLYLKMLAVATSRVKQISSNITDLKSVVNLLFQYFEDTHGQVYVTQTLRIITISKYGMSEDELMDMLSCNSQVLSDVKLKCHGLPFHDCTLNQLPVIVWSRLLNDLCPHLLCFRMSVDGAWLLQWKNRRLKEIAMERYLKSKQSLVESNQLIADYFSGKMAAERKVLEPEITYGNLSDKDIVSDDQQSTLQSHSHTSNQHESELVTTQECNDVILPVRNINPQPLKLSQGIYNLRRLTELPLALLNAKQHGPLIEMLLHHRFLNACAQMGVTDHVITVISLLIEPIDINRQYGSVASELRLLQKALALSINNLTKNPSQLSIELLGRLLPYGMNAIDQPHINALLTDTIINNRLRLTPLHSYSAHPSEHILLSLAGHLDAITCIDSTITSVQNDEDDCTEERVVIVSSSADGTLRGWDWRGSGVLKTFDGHSGAVLCVAVSKNGHYTASGGEDHTVRFWRVHDAKCLHVLNGHTGPVTGTAATKLCNKVVSGSLDGTVKVWNSEQSSRCKGELVYTLRPAQALVTTTRRLPIHSICLCKDDSELLVGLANGYIVVINVVAGEILRYFDTSLAIRKPVQSIAMAQVGDKRMVVSVSDSSAHVNDYCTGKQVDSVPCEIKLYGKLAGRDIQSVVARLPDSIISNDASITALSFSDLGKFGITGSDNGCIKIWDLKKSEHLQTLSNGAIFDITCSPNGDCIATLCEQKDNTVVVNLSKADDLTQPFATLKRTDSRVTSVKFYNDSDCLFTAHEDGIVRLWDIKTSEITDEFPCKGSGTGSNIDPSAVTCITISDNHKVLIAGTADGRLVLWNITKRTRLQSKTTANDHDHSIIKITITPGSVRYLVSADASGTTVVRDYGTLEVIGIDRREKGVELCCLGVGLDYSHNMMMARAYIDGKIEVSSVPALELVWVLDSGGHVTCGNGHVTSVNYLCGKLIATHCHDDRSGCVQIWDKGTCLYSCVTDSGITSAIVICINRHGVILYGDQEGYVGAYLYNLPSYTDNDVTLSLLRQSSLATVTTVTTDNQRKLSDVSRARISQTTLQSLKEVEETTIEDTPLQGREAGPEWEGPKEDATPPTKEEEIVQSECPLNEDNDIGNDTIQQPSSSTCTIL